MKILVIGENRHFEECRQKLGPHDYTHLPSSAAGESVLAEHDVVFDFITANMPGGFASYANQPVTVFLNTCKVTLLELAHHSSRIRCTLFGFNGFPSLFNRDVLEVSLLKSEDAALLEKHCKQLGLDYLVVDDRVGMVTARVICMIINEAYFTVQEGTASREDIDLAMKLGTNYPYGPFEWCVKIGVKDVYELLDALYKDTKDERYKISALMKREYLRAR